MFFKKFSPAFARSTSSLLTLIWRMPKFSVRSSRHVVFEIPTSSSTSRTVKWWLERITLQTSRMSLSFFDVEGGIARLLSSTEVRLSLKRLHLSWVFVLLMASSPNACFNISKVSENAFLIWNKISHKHAAHENHAEKSAEQARHAFPLIDTMCEQTRTIRVVEQEPHCYAALLAGPRSTFALAR